jgi:hypothetical protein
MTIPSNDIINIAWMLLGCHIFGDWVFQSHVMATEKSRHSESTLQKFVPWYWWLTGHGFVHGFLVSMVTQSISLGLMEFVAHTVIDFGKTEGKYGMVVDQSLHLACKVVWVYLMFGPLPAFMG